MVNSDKRQRHKDGHRSRVDAARAAAVAARRRRTTIIVALIAVLVVAGSAVVSLTGGNGDKPVVATAPTTASSAPATTANPNVPVPKAGATITGATPCPKADGSSARTTTFAKAPPTCIAPARTYTAVVATSEGDITIALDAKQSPIAVNNFVVLSRYHFYDKVPFHRIVKGFVDQTGDAVPGATGPGSGGPGYDLPDEEPKGAYVKGDVAMARAAKVSGSQFFFTIDPTSLNSAPAGQKYPLLGKVTAGQNVVDAINQLGGGDEKPTRAVTITTVTITES